MTRNHDRMIEIQADRPAPRDGSLEIACYGSSAFRITSPKGVSVMIDPYRDPLRPHAVIPHHYSIWDVLQRPSTLQSAEPRVDTREVVEMLTGPRRTYSIKDIRHLDRAMHFFGEHVAFDKKAWLRDGC